MCVVLKTLILRLIFQVTNPYTPHRLMLKRYAVYCSKHLIWCTQRLPCCTLRSPSVLVTIPKVGCQKQCMMPPGESVIFTFQKFLLNITYPKLNEVSPTFPYQNIPTKGVPHTHKGLVVHTCTYTCTHIHAYLNILLFELCFCL